MSECSVCYTTVEDEEELAMCSKCGALICEECSEFPENREGIARLCDPCSLEVEAAE